MERGVVGFLCDGPGSHRVGSRQTSVHTLTPPADSSQQEEGQGQAKHLGITSIGMPIGTVLLISLVDDHEAQLDLERNRRTCSNGHQLRPESWWPSFTNLYGLRGNNRLSLNKSYRAKSAQINGAELSPRVACRASPQEAGRARYASGQHLGISLPKVGRSVGCTAARSMRRPLTGQLTTR